MSSRPFTASQFSTKKNARENRNKVSRSKGLGWGWGVSEAGKGKIENLIIILYLTKK